MSFVYLPTTVGKIGVDDYLANGATVEDLYALAEDELREPPPEEKPKRAPALPTAQLLHTIERLFCRFVRFPSEHEPAALALLDAAHVRARGGAGNPVRARDQPGEALREDPGARGRRAGGPRAGPRGEHQRRRRVPGDREVDADAAGRRDRRRVPRQVRAGRGAPRRAERREPSRQPRDPRHPGRRAAAVRDVLPQGDRRDQHRPAAGHDPRPVDRDRDGTPPTRRDRRGPVPRRARRPARRAPPPPRGLGGREHRAARRVATAGPDRGPRRPPTGGVGSAVGDRRPRPGRLARERPAGRDSAREGRRGRRRRGARACADRGAPIDLRGRGLGARVQDDLREAERGRGAPVRRVLERRRDRAARRSRSCSSRTGSNRGRFVPSASRDTARGYHADQFGEVWARYAPENDARDEGDPREATHPTQATHPNADGHSDVSDVSDVSHNQQGSSHARHSPNGAEPTPVQPLPHPDEGESYEQWEARVEGMVARGEL